MQHAPAPHALPAPSVAPSWAFPTAAAPSPQRAVMGGGSSGATATMTRIRWGRVLPALAGALLLAFGIWNVAHSTARPTGASSGGIVSAIGGGAAPKADEDDTAGEDGALDIAAADEAADSAPAATTPRAATSPATKPPHRTKRVVKRAAAAAAITAPRVATARGASGSGTAGSGAGAAPAAGELPFTGLETWIAGVLGLVLLAFGICIHVNAVRLGMTAMLYRRGILLRPVECARLAQERGLPQLRIHASNLLHRLLEEPNRASDFVTARLAR